jgi:hypothetical protein
MSIGGVPSKCFVEGYSMKNVRFFVERMRGSRAVAFGTGAVALAFLGLFVLSLGAAPSPQVPKPVVRTAPRITSFKLNNGAASTTSRTVTLNNTVEGQVSEYRASARADYLEGSLWKPYSTAPTYELNVDSMTPDWLPDSTKIFHCQIFFQVRYKPVGKLPFASEPIVSVQVFDAIDYIVPAREHTVPVGEAIQYTRNEGYSSSGQAADPNSDCALNAHFDGPLILQTFGKPIPLIGGTYGAKADFKLFEGRRLNPRWKFKKISVNDTNCSGIGGQRNGYSKLLWPRADTDDITIRLHTWCEGNHICEVILVTLTLWGPGDGHWKHAFSYIH